MFKFFKISKFPNWIHPLGKHYSVQPIRLFGSEFPIGIPLRGIACNGCFCLHHFIAWNCAIIVKKEAIKVVELQEWKYLCSRDVNVLIFLDFSFRSSKVLTFETLRYKWNFIIYRVTLRYECSALEYLIQSKVLVNVIEKNSKLCYTFAFDVLKNFPNVALMLM